MCYDAVADPGFDVEGVGRNFFNGEGALKSSPTSFPGLRHFIEPSGNVWSAFCAFLRTIFTQKNFKSSKHYRVSFQTIYCSFILAFI